MWILLEAEGRDVEVLLAYGEGGAGEWRLILLAFSYSCGEKS